VITYLSKAKTPSNIAIIKKQPKTGCPETSTNTKTSSQETLTIFSEFSPETLTKKH